MTHPRRTNSAAERAFQDLSEALSGPADAEGAELSVRVDPNRTERTGIPEIVYAERKGPEQVIEAVKGLLAANGSVIVSRVSPDQVERLRHAFPSDVVHFDPKGWTVAITRADSNVAATGGRIAVIAAGSSDWPAAHEARVVAEAMGCDVDFIVDVGVAGLHRLIGPLRRVLDGGADAIVVAAGMDGALPSVVAGLVPMPVIGLPTSIGYGYGGAGEAALLSMLQSCAPGLTVVNIDNAVGAGASAALIANRVAQARRAPGQPAG